MSRYLDGLEQGARVKFGNLEDRIEKLENITLDFDEEGIWLIELNPDAIPEQIGHVSWRIIANYVRIENRKMEALFDEAHSNIKDML